MATSAEYDLGEFAFPRGWFIVAQEEEATSKPTPLRYFGKDLVMYRGASERVVVMDAYCPHMKTHLAKNDRSFVVLDGNQVEGDDIRCPYHAWKFGPDGMCNEIPYSPAPIPKTASIHSYPVLEWGGFILIWHDMELGEPDYQPYALPEWENQNWLNWKIDYLGQLDLHPIEIIDNMCDKAHLAPIHGTLDVSYFENEISGLTLRQRVATNHRMMPDSVMSNDTWYLGPGFLLSRMNTFYNSIMLVAHTPVEDGTVKAWHGLLVELKSETPSDEDLSVIQMFQESSHQTLLQDFDVWNSKDPCFNILQVIGDGPFSKARSWYKQFYNPRDKASEIHTAVDGVYVTKGTHRDPWDTPALKH